MAKYTNTEILSMVASKLIMEIFPKKMVLPLVVMFMGFLKALDEVRSDSILAEVNAAIAEGKKEQIEQMFGSEFGKTVLETTLETLGGKKAKKAKKAKADGEPPKETEKYTFSQVPIESADSRFPHPSMVTVTKLGNTVYNAYTLFIAATVGAIKSRRDVWGNASDEQRSVWLAAATELKSRAVGDKLVKSGLVAYAPPETEKKKSKKSKKEPVPAPVVEPAPPAPVVEPPVVPEKPKKKSKKEPAPAPVVEPAPPAPVAEPKKKSKKESAPIPVPVPVPSAGANMSSLSSSSGSSIPVPKKTARSGLYPLKSLTQVPSVPDPSPKRP